MRFITPIDSKDKVRQEIGSVNDVAQDHLGFIWIGAENGLARFDGKSLVLFQEQAGNSASLPSNYVFKLLVDHDNVLWVATEGGLAQYDVTSNTFRRVQGVGGISIDVDSVSSLALGKDNSLYIGAARGLYILSPDRSVLTKHIPHPPIKAQRSVEQVRDIAIHSNGTVWLATAGMGVAIFDPSTGVFRYLMKDGVGEIKLKHNSVRSILHDSQGRTWLGTYGGGITRVERDGKSVTHVDLKLSHLLSDRAVIWDIVEDSKGDIYVASDQGGLAKFEAGTGTVHHSMHRSYDAFSLVSNQLRVIFEDNNRDLWFGGSPSGVSLYSREAQAFTHYVARPNDENSLSDNSVIRITASSDGNIWIGTESGLNELEPATGNITRYLSGSSGIGSVSGRAVLAVQEDIDGSIWVGTWGGGLYRLNRQTGEFKHFAEGVESGALSSQFIWDLLLDSRDRLWVGTETGGVNLYDRAQESFISFRFDSDNENSLSGDFVSSLMEDSQGNIWIGGYTGVNVFDPQAQKFTQIPYEVGAGVSTNTKNTKAFFEDSSGRVWIGTQHKGVNIYSPESATFSYLNINHGLPSQNVSGIIEDDDGYIWMATGGGAVMLDPNTQVVRVLDADVDLAGINHNREALYKDKAGRLYLGSADGMTSFHPAEIRQSPRDFPLNFVAFKIFNEDAAVGVGRELSESILTETKVDLSYDQNFFTIEFSALDYKNAKRMHYRYRLSGVDKGWVDSGQYSTATYTNLDAGRYVFNVQASTDRNHWVDGRPLIITIGAPFWRSGWAYCFYLLFALFLIFYSHRHVRLKAQAEAYRKSSLTDALTGTLNRFGVQQVTKEVFESEGLKRNKGLAIVDIDHFKKINDNFGHNVGDAVLIETANVLRAAIRQSDCLGRWGGEEFILIFDYSTPENAAGFMEKIRVSVAGHRFEKQVSVTISAGYCPLGPNIDFESALELADGALYRAKRSGRNKVLSADFCEESRRSFKK